MTTTNNLVIAAVPPNLVELLWDSCVPHIERVVERSHGEITLDSVKNTLLSGDTMLITISKGAEVIAINTIEVREMQSGLRALFIPIVGGNDLDEWMPEFLGLAKQIAKDLNCTELRGLAVRPGWMKKLEPMGWENVHMILRCDVGE